jgi:hypothetical protein
LIFSAPASDSRFRFVITGLALGELMALQLAGFKKYTVDWITRGARAGVCAQDNMQGGGLK